jgi:flagellar assembly protein FliH
MTQHFRAFEFKELKQPEDERRVVQPYPEPQFEHPVDAEGADEIHKKRDAFQLDRNVANQLGMEERERQAAEARIKKEIERRWEQVSEKAEVNGYTKGLEEGKAEAYRAELPRIQERIGKLEHLLQSFDGMRDKIFSANESFLMDIIAQVAGMVVLKEVEIDRDYLRRVITALIHQLGTQDDLKIYLSMADHENVENLRAALEKEFGKLNHTVIEPSPEIPVGGCKIETKFGVVDASVATQIENVMKAVKG